MRAAPAPKGSLNFKALFEAAPGLYLVLLPDLTIVAASDAYLQATMTERDAIVGRGIFEVFPDNPGDPAATGTGNLRTSLERVLKQRSPDAMAVQKYDIRKPDSEGGEFEERFWSPLNSPVFGADREICYIIHRVEDVTDYVRLKEQGVQQREVTEELQDRAGRMESEILLRAQQVQQANCRLEAANQELAKMNEKAHELERLKLQLLSEQSEEERRASEQRYGQLFRVNPLPMWVSDSKTFAFLAVNLAAIQKYGYSREEFLTMTTQEIEVSEDTPSKDDARHHHSPTARHRKKDGTIIVVELTANELPFEGREARLVAVADVTEKKRIETQLLRTQRMESIATLAGGIAHDLNNVLAPILMAVPFLSQNTTDPDCLEALETLDVSAKRGASIVRQLMTFGRGAKGERVPTQLKHLIVGTEQIVAKTFPKSIRLQSDVPKNLWLVVGDPSQLDQLILELCLNARDAMSQGGTLKVSAQNTILDEQCARLHAEAEPGLYVVVEVSDTGAGITPAVMDKIFEPFFTTKPVGQGSGLGLSTLRAIVKSHGGFVNVYSEAGAGTRFQVYLPALESADARTAEAQQAVLPSGRGELILVADDEKAVRDITTVTLESHNYRVITAKDGAEAVANYARQGTEIRVVLLDMMMPVMDGPPTIRALEAINPDVRIVAASGLIDNLYVQSATVRATLAKPYTAEKLLVTLHKVIDAAE